MCYTANSYLNLCMQSLCLTQGYQPFLNRNPNPNPSLKPKPNLNPIPGDPDKPNPNLIPGDPDPDPNLNPIPDPNPNRPWASQSEEAKDKSLVPQSGES